MKIFKSNALRASITVLSTCFLVLSCDKDDPLINLDGEPGVATASNTSIDPAEVSFFDQAPIQYELFSALSVVTDIQVGGDGVSETIPMSDKKGIFEADFEKLNLNAIEDEFKFGVTPSIGNNTLEIDSLTISVINPVALEAPEKLIKTKTKDDFLKYNIISEQVDDAVVTIEQKTFFDGEYIEIVGDRSSTIDSLAFKASDYNKLDTIYFKVTATKDELVAAETVKVFIDTEYLGGASELVLSDSNKFYSLKTLGGVLDVNSELEFIPNDDSENLGIMVSDSDSFKLVAYPEVDVKKVFDFGDKLETIKIVNSESALTDVVTLKTSDLYAYKITREEAGKPVNFYGLIKVEAIINSDSGNTVTLLVKEAK